MQTGERDAVAAIGFDPIPAPLGHHGRTHHDAVEAVARQVSMNPEAARAGLVDEVHDSARCLQRPHDFVERLDIGRDHPIMPDLSQAAALGHRDVDRFLVDIHPYEHATFHHDLPPLCVALRDAFAGSSNPR